MIVPAGFRTHFVAFAVVCGVLGAARVAASEALGHPRLYMTSADLGRLRALRTEGVHARIWNNIEESANWCLRGQPREAWIAPVGPADGPGAPAGEIVVEIGLPRRK